MQQDPGVTRRTALVIDDVPLDYYLPSSKYARKAVEANTESYSSASIYRYDVTHGGIISVSADAASGAPEPDGHGDAPAPPLPDLSMPTAHLDIIHQTVWKVRVDEWK